MAVPSDVIIMKPVPGIALSGETISADEFYAAQCKRHDADRLEKYMLTVADWNYETREEVRTLLTDAEVRAHAQREKGRESDAIHEKQLELIKTLYAHADAKQLREALQQAIQSTRLA